MKNILYTIGLALFCMLHAAAPAMEKPALIKMSGPHEITAHEQAFYAYAPDGMPIGKILFLMNPHTKVARIQLMKVDSRFRGLGIGHQLFKKCFKYVTIVGCSSIHWVAYPIDTIELNQLVTIYLKMIQKLHTNQSFEFTMHKTHDGFGIDCFAMQLKIRK